jgi:nitric oxide reductase large subunit
MARLGYSKALAIVFLGSGAVLLVLDVLNGSLDPPLAFILGHRVAAIFEQVVFWLLMAGLVYGLANSESKNE